MNIVFLSNKLGLVSTKHIPEFKPELESEPWVSGLVYRGASGR